MKIPKFLDDLSVISKLGDNPGADNGLTAEGLKAKFDEAGLKLQTFLNETLIEKINSLFSLDAPPHEGMNMTGPINMNKNKLGGLADPAEDGDAVNLKFANENYRAADWLPTIAEIGAAPAGYGFGEDLDARSGNTTAAWGENYAEFCAKIDAELATMGNQTAKLVLARGIVGEKDPTNPYYKALNCLAILFRKHSFDEAHLVTLAHGAVTPGTEWRMQKTGGVWQPLEYVNPLLEAGIEYRTTERFAGRPVYKQLVSVGWIAEGGQFNVPHNIADIAYPLGCDFVDSNEHLSSVATIAQFTKTNFILQLPSGHGGKQVYAVVSYDKG